MANALTEPIAVKPHPVIFVVPGDLHLTDTNQENYRVANQAIEEINRLIQPDFVQFVGDNAQEAQTEQFELFNQLRGRLAAPSDVIVGDHDVHEDPNAEGFQQYVGATYGVRTFPGARFVRLNTQQAKPVGLSDEQIAWFRNEVKAAESMREQVVVFQHNYPYQIWENFDGPGIDAWREIVQTHRIAAIVCGHTHYFQEANDGRNIAIAVRSIGDPEGGAPGYLVGFLQEDDLAFAYRTVEETGPFVLVTHPREAILATTPRHIVSSDDQVRVLIRSASPIVSAQWSIDTGEWQPLAQTDGDFWIGMLSVERMAKGMHRLSIMVRSEEGWTTQREQEFVVDTTGRYTAVPVVHYSPLPTVRPVVTATQFC